MRFPYKNGDMKATRPVAAGGRRRCPAAARLRGGGHWTRDIVFSQDGKRMFVSVGSHSNVDDPDTTPAEFHRADILEYTPDGKFVKVYASGIRNCVGEAIHPATGQLWCSVNERDELGDNLVPDYITHVEEGGFYGWPWFYIGNHQDPRHKGKHPELKAKVIVPDVLLQPHFASLGMTFYDGKQFPAAYHGGPSRRSTARGTRPSAPAMRSSRVPIEERQGHRRVRGLPDRLRHPGRQRLGPPGGRRRRRTTARYSSPTMDRIRSGTSPTLGTKQVAGK